jgi:hypothetical protein
MMWEEKLAALQALAPWETSLRMRKPGDWYVDQHDVECIEVGHRGMLALRYGNGPTPEAAVEDHWQQLTSNDVEAIVLHATDAEKRREVQWNGFMWRTLEGVAL